MPRINSLIYTSCYDNIHELKLLQMLYGHACIRQKKIGKFQLSETGPNDLWYKEMY